ncbi:MAG: endonuclease/exonuclease/phosphatase family protein [Phycisphaerales bacterium]|nr:endonuclease/exonuclease/phosphatase family protein [Phycisphaerales bacterium]
MNHMTFTVLIRWAMALCVLVLVTSPSAAPAEEPAEDTLRVLVWNVLHGANDVEQGAEKALAIIRDVQPDVVLMQESYDIDGDRPKLGAWLAQELGWRQWQGESAHLCVLTPLEIEAEFFHHVWHGIGAKLTDQKGRTFIAWSIWIDWRAYITEELRDNPDMSDEELLAAEHERSSRLPQAKAIIAHLDEVGHSSADVPVLVGGDWNTPSHLDWTEDTARIYKHRRPLPLPVSTAMQAAGYTDTFRVVHPNPVQRPGLTWSPMFRHSEGKDTGFERIDRLYLKNPERPEGGWVLQPTGGYVLPVTWEDDAIAIENRQFPSDHGAVVMDLEWRQQKPAPAKAAQGEATTLKVLAFNILRSGNAPGPNGDSALYQAPRHAAIAEVIRDTEADIVLVQEEYRDDRVFKLLQASDPAWQRRDNGTRGQATYARYPITAMDRDTSRIAHPDGPIVVHNVHWKPSPYGPSIIQERMLEGTAIDVDEILSASDKGDIYMKTYRSVHPSLAEGLPVIVGGDFNEPSHLDWTTRAANDGAARWVDNPTGTPLTRVVPWKGSSMLLGPEAFREELDLPTGAELIPLVDAFRAVRPDVVTDPGFTWTPYYVGGTEGRRRWSADGAESVQAAQPTATLDRIDMIYTSADLTPVRVHVLGDEGDPNTDQGYSDWPSDHRAVLAIVEWHPAAAR